MSLSESAVELTDFFHFIFAFILFSSLYSLHFFHCYPQQHEDKAESAQTIQ